METLTFMPPSTQKNRTRPVQLAHSQRATPPSPSANHATSDAVDCVVLNDVHSRLNATRVFKVAQPKSTLDVATLVRQARCDGTSVSVSGARHAMGGQQFAENALHLDMTRMNRVLNLNTEHGLAVVQAGATWPDVLNALETLQPNCPQPWTFTQKQTGADHLTLGGAVSANIHGRGLAWQPFVQDVESLVLVNAEGAVVKASRMENAELFRLVVGGYGLFGIITEVELRLRPRQKLQRIAEVTTLQGLVQRIDERVLDGFVMGDFQFNPDERATGFLRDGVFSCYKPAQHDVEMPSQQTALSPESWRRLIILAHSDKELGWQNYTRHYARTNGQIYSSDHAQLSHYDDDYEERLQKALPELPAGSLMISELYVPRARLEDLMAACADDFRLHETNAIYGTIRFIKQDAETFLAWAREDFACIVFNLRVTHTPAGIEKAKAAFRLLIDRALERGGSFYLTYHPWATRDQMLRAYPQFPEFLHMKRKYDPTERFQSGWYRHWKKVIAEDSFDQL